MNSYLQVPLLTTLFALVSIAVATNASASSESIAYQLRESGNVPDSWTNALEWILTLREENRGSIHSLEVVYTRMNFLSEYELHSRYERSSGVIPANEYPNPDIKNIHFIQKEDSLFIRTQVPLMYVKAYSKNDVRPLRQRNSHYIPAERRQEYVNTIVGHFQVSEELPLTSDFVPVSHFTGDKGGRFTKDGTVLSKIFIDDVFTPEIHELTSLEGIASRIASGTGVLEDIIVGLNEGGKNVLTMVVKFDSHYKYWDVEEWLYLTYSIDDNGLLIELVSEQRQERRDGEMSANVRVSLSDVTFANFETEKGRVVLPTKALISFCCGKPFFR